MCIFLIENVIFGNYKCNFALKNRIQSHSLLGVNVLVLQVVNFRVRLNVYAVALFE